MRILPSLSFSNSSTQQIDIGGPLAANPDGQLSIVSRVHGFANEALHQEDAKEEQSETRAKARQEASLRKLADALAQRPEGDTLSGLADLAGLSRKRAKEGLDTLLERGKAVGCKVTKGRGNREMEGFKLVGV